VSRIVTHNCWRNKVLSQQVIALSSSAIEEGTHDTVRPHFRVLLSVLSIEDDLQKQRVDWVVSSLLSSMQVLQRYWKITDLCIEHLIRMAKQCPLACAWLQTNTSRYAWVIDWLTENENPPVHHHHTMSVVKPGRTFSTPQWPAQGASYPTHTGLHPKQKKRALEKIKAKAALGTDNASDSDEDLEEREFEVGDRVDCLNSTNPPRWVVAEVVQVCGRRATIRFDGWNTSEEWVDMADPRIARLGRHTTETQQLESMGGGDQEMRGVERTENRSGLSRLLPSISGKSKKRSP